jgi:hypothetical protein
MPYICTYSTEGEYIRQFFDVEASGNMAVWETRNCEYAIKIESWKYLVKNVI